MAVTTCSHYPLVFTSNTTARVQERQRTSCSEDARTSCPLTRHTWSPSFTPASSAGPCCRTLHHHQQGPPLKTKDLFTYTGAHPRSCSPTPPSSERRTLQRRSAAQTTRPSVSPGAAAISARRPCESGTPPTYGADKLGGTAGGARTDLHRHAAHGLVVDAQNAVLVAQAGGRGRARVVHWRSGCAALEMHPPYDRKPASWSCSSKPQPPLLCRWIRSWRVSVVLPIMNKVGR